jgi:hypothetical protein
MRKYLRALLLWLFVIKLGTVFGAGLYEARACYELGWKTA